MKSVSNILNAQSTGLNRLLERAKLLQLLSHQLQSFLGAPINDHVCVANIRENTLVITADNATWLTKVRYLAPEILQYIKQEVGLDNITKLHFRVRSPHTNLSSGDTSNNNHLSDNALQLISDAAEQVTDENLKAALQRLAQQHLLK